MKYFYDTYWFFEMDVYLWFIACFVPSVLADVLHYYKLKILDIFMAGELRLDPTLLL